jgi:hypothetical protein
MRLLIPLAVAAVALMLAPVATADVIDPSCIDGDAQWFQVSTSNYITDETTFNLGGFIGYNFDVTDDAVREKALELIGQNGSSIDVLFEVFTRQVDSDSYEIKITQAVTQSGTLEGGLVDLFIRDIDCLCDPENEIHNVNVTGPFDAVMGEWHVLEPGDLGYEAFFDDGSPTGGTDIQMIALDVVDFKTTPVVITFDCIPEPSAMAILLLASVPVVLRRRARG